MQFLAVPKCSEVGGQTILASRGVSPLIHSQSQQRFEAIQGLTPPARLTEQVLHHFATVDDFDGASRPGHQFLVGVDAELVVNRGQRLRLAPGFLLARWRSSSMNRKRAPS